MLRVWHQPLTVGRLTVWWEAGLYRGRYVRSDGSPAVVDQYPTLRGLLCRLYFRTGGG